MGAASFRSPVGTVEFPTAHRCAFLVAAPPPEEGEGSTAAAPPERGKESAATSPPNPTTAIHLPPPPAPAEPPATATRGLRRLRDALPPPPAQIPSSAGLPPPKAFPLNETLYRAHHPLSLTQRLPMSYSLLVILFFPSISFHSSFYGSPTEIF